MRSADDFNSLLTQSGRVFQLMLRFGIVDDDTGASGREKFRGCHTAASHTDDENLFSLHLHARYSWVRRLFSPQRSERRQTGLTISFFHKLPRPLPPTALGTRALLFRAPSTQFQR